jgi:hypothetical protein
VMEGQTRLERSSHPKEEKRRFLIAEAWVAGAIFGRAIQLTD